MDDSSDIFYLHELIDALDRRRPQPERADYPVIAREGAALRTRALRRLSELEGRRGTERAVGSGAPPRTNRQASRAGADDRRTALRR